MLSEMSNYMSAPQGDPATNPNGFAARMSFAESREEFEAIKSEFEAKYPDFQVLEMVENGTTMIQIWNDFEFVVDFTIPTFEVEVVEVEAEDMEWVALSSWMIQLFHCKADDLPFLKQVFEDWDKDEEYDFGLMAALAMEARLLDKAKSLMEEQVIENPLSMDQVTVITSEIVKIYSRYGEAVEIEVTKNGRLAYVDFRHEGANLVKVMAVFPNGLVL